MNSCYGGSQSTTDPDGKAHDAPPDPLEGGYTGTLLRRASRIFTFDYRQP